MKHNIYYESYSNVLFLRH